MGIFKTPDGTEIFYKDWGSGQPIVFSHGWPLTADDWDTQMLFFLHHGYRVIAHDRRGHGRSSQTSGGHDMDHYAADLAALATHLDVKKAVHIGHSTGGGEVAALYRSTRARARGEGRAGRRRAAGDGEEGGQSRRNCHSPCSTAFAPRWLRTGRNSSCDVPSGPFYGFNRPGAKVSEGVIRNWWRQGMMGAANAHYDCIKAFSETDFTEDLKKIDGADARDAWRRRSGRAVCGLGAADS